MARPQWPTLRISNRKKWYERGGTLKGETSMEIERRFASARKAKGDAQEQLTDLTGLSIKMISAAENRHRAMRLENILKLCDCLSIAADDLAAWVVHQAERFGRIWRNKASIP